MKNKLKFRKIFIAVLLLFALSSSPAYTAARRAAKNSYDIIIAGAGTGGISAAIQAARMGIEVLVVEPSSWIGGQATAAGVSTMDDMSRQKSGLYLELINRIQNYYDYRGKSMGTCYWSSNSVAFEPHVGQEILVNLINEARRKGTIDFLMSSEITSVNKNKNKITGVTVKTLEGERRYACKVLIDATEYGDMIPLCKIPYRAGNSVSPFLNPDAMVQEITWPAVIHKYMPSVPDYLKPREPLPGYELAKRNYESYVSADGFNFKNTYPVQTPVNFVTHNAYRGLPDSSNPYSYDADKENREYITKTVVNWGNDYPGTYAWNGKRGLPVGYLENRELRREVERAALLKTLHFIYYIQNELGEEWSVADDEYKNRILPDAARGLPAEWQEIAKRMPVIPYVRESRRIVGFHTLTSHELLQNSLSYRDGQTSHEFPDAIAIGGYILDLHGANTDADMEWDLDERANTSITNRPRGPFQVPMSILIPKETDGFIAAEKNLSMSRLAQGALRLQPITMMTGQAAGALAAMSVKEKKTPREVHPLSVQWALLEAGVSLSLCHYTDVPETHSLNKSVQISNLYGLTTPNEYPHSVSFNLGVYDDPVWEMAIIKGDDKGVFGLNDLITTHDTLAMLENAQKIVGLKKRPRPSGLESDKLIARGEFARAVCEALPALKNIPRAKGSRLPFKVERNRNYDSVVTLAYLGALNVYMIDGDFHYGRPVTKGEAIDIIVKACVNAVRN
ncbi:MAG: FAD-dependent oxidoreductase [Synergistaceae bacterium]|nr:FAD-dependent oxidoreductase [Synergistaceae bacterium]